MLLSSWLITGILILVQSALCSDVQDDISANGKLPNLHQVETETYGYNHPPSPETTLKRGSRKEKSLNINEQIPLSNNSRSRRLRQRTSRKPNTKSDLEIPVEVIYDTKTTTPRLGTTQTTSSSATKPTRVFVRRQPLKSNTNKKIDIRQTTASNQTFDDSNDTENKQSSSITTPESEISVPSTTSFPKRSRGSYFQKRTGTPAPRVKILEEKNFVYSHSGNFHYSFLGGDGTKVSSQGELRSYDNDKTGEAVSGNVFYKDKDGNDVSLSYTADENGYRPIGAHLPTPPPLPPAIARALKYIADKSTASPISTDNN